MKLVIDIRLINASGIGRYLKNILPDIIEEFSQVVVLGNKEEIAEFEWAEKVEIIEFNAGIYSIKEQFLYPFIIPKCDVFWCPHFNFPIFPIRAGKKVVTIHDVNHLTGISPISILKKAYAYLLFKTAVLKTDLIFTVSEFSKTEIIKYTSAKTEKIKVVYCGVDISFFEEFKNEESLRLPQNYILYVGNVKPHKNLIILLKAYSTFPDEFKSKFQLLIVGKKDGFRTKDDYLDTYIKSNNLEENIIFTGHIDDSFLACFYQKASLFVFPSFYEGFGLPILEALASGTAVISSNTSSLPEIGGDAVVYFDPTNYIELAQKIKDCLEDTNISQKKIEQRGVQLKKFTWKKSIENHLEEFAKILKIKEGY